MRLAEFTYINGMIVSVSPDCVRLIKSPGGAVELSTINMRKEISWNLECTYEEARNEINNALNYIENEDW